MKGCNLKRLASKCIVIDLLYKWQLHRMGIVRVSLLKQVHGKKYGERCKLSKYEDCLTIRHGVAALKGFTRCKTSKTWYVITQAPLILVATLRSMIAIFKFGVGGYL